METNTFFLLAADLVLFVHLLFAAFVVLGLVLIYLGKWLRWAWVANPWLRSVHLACIALVVAQSWLGVVCPLTTLEMQLREAAGEAVYEGAFIAHWLQALLYYQAPPWIFTLAYTVFAALVMISWLFVPPRRFRRTGFGSHDSTGISGGL